jgi:Rrf2 family iron-sulfur cluster assembly transcriptional regulator
MAIADLAILELQGDDIKPVVLSTISERQKISLSYLEQLFAKLKRAGLVKSVKGPGGGYNLAKPTDQIKLSEIKQAIDSKNNIALCPEDNKCRKGRACNSHLLWTELGKQLDSFLYGITLENLLNNDFVKVKID